MMTRSITAIVVALAAVSSAAGNLNSRSDASPFDKVRLSGRAEKLHGPGPQEDFRIDARTEVRLNGRPCQYKDVPGEAVITFLEVAQDNKTILRIHFQTGR